MSLDRSLRSADALVRHRNVLSRAERLGILEEQGKWTDQKSPFGLPKVAHRKVEAAKPVKEEAAEGEAVAGATPAAGAAPAAGAKGAVAAGAKGAAPAAAAGAKGAAPAAKAAAPKKK